MEQCRWNSDSEIGGTVKKCLCNSVVEQWNSGTVWWNSGTVTVEQCWWNSACRTGRWNSGTVWWNR